MPPTRSGSPSREASFSRGLSPQPDSSSRSTNATHENAALGRRRRAMGARSLSPERPRALAETGALHRLEPGDARARQRLVAGLLEDQPQPVECRVRLALHPAVHAKPLLERLTRGPGIVPVGHLDPGEARAGSCQLPRHATLGTQVAPAVCTLDDPPRRLGLDDRHLQVEAREGGIEQVAGGGAEALRARAGEPVVLLEVVAPGGTEREVRDVVVDRLAAG